MIKYLILPKENKTNMTLDEIIEYNKNVSKDEEEIWKKIRFKKWDPSDYSVSSKGRIRNDRRNKILSPYLDPRSGYYVITLYTHESGNKKKRYTMQDLVATYFCPWRNKSSIDHVHHINPSEKTNNNYWNLVFVSVLEHTMIHDGLNYYNPKKGDDHPNSKYTNEQIENACMLMEEGVKTNKEISIITGVNIRDIGYIRYGRNWKHISHKYNIPKLKDANRETKFYDDNIIHEICKLIIAGKSNKDISDILNVKHDTVSNIRHGKSHRDISSKYGLSII